MRTKGKPEELERTRIKAINAVNAGNKQVDVARIFGLYPDTLSKWMTRYRRDPESILAKTIPGRKPRLSPEQLDELVVFKIVTEKLKWSFQRPEKVARERDPKKVEHWLNEELPEIKKSRRRRSDLDLL